jgi:hypothetical protein
MATVNKDPFKGTTRKNGLPSVTRLPVQAGSTATIHIGDICAFNKTAGYVTVIDAESDFIYALLIAKEEQKTADAARYISFYDLDPADEFEFALNAARSLAVGNRFVLTASAQQTLTYSATKYPVCRCVGDDHYPESGTTIRSQSYARVSFNPACSYFGLISNGFAWGTPKQATLTTATTLYYEMSGLTIIHTGASTASVSHVLPVAGTAPVGTNFKAINLNSGTGTVKFDPGTGSAIYVDGVAQTDNADQGMTQTAETGSFMAIQAIASNDWYSWADSGSGTGQAIA